MIRTDMIIYIDPKDFLIISSRYNACELLAFVKYWERSAMSNIIWRNIYTGTFILYKWVPSLFCLCTFIPGNHICNDEHDIYNRAAPMCFRQYNSKAMITKNDAVTNCSARGSELMVLDTLQKKTFLEKYVRETSIKMMFCSTLKAHIPEILCFTL